MSTIHTCFDPHQPVNTVTMEQMLSASQYWSPDASNQAASKNQHCMLAKASLYNTERSKSDTVYKDSISGLIISANARIDNRDELARQLRLNTGALPHFTDSQLILKAYAHWGEDCPRYLLGDFVFIIWDETQQRLFCARDHFGVKVLFYSHKEQAFMVTNEHNAFFTSHWLAKNIRESWLVSHLWGLGPVPFESPYQGIQVLPPAHRMVLDKAGIKISRYWNLQQQSNWQGMHDEALIAELQTRFRHAVRQRLDSAYPLGAELSEGLDSNGIVGHAAQMLGDNPLYTFSYSCEALTQENRSVWEKTYQDIFGMLELHDNLQPVWTTEPASEAQHERELEVFHRYFGGILNIHDGHFLRSRLSHQQGVRTLLSGWGGDHCVSSYGNFYESELFKQAKLFSIHQLFKDKFRRGRGNKPIRAWLSLLLKHYASPLYRARLRNRGGLEHAMHERAKQHFLKQEMITRYQCDKKLKYFTDHYQVFSTQAYCKRELFTVGVENRLAESEICARLFKVEYRYPMLDVPLVEFAYNLPGHLTIHRGIERYMFRRVLQGITTPRIQWRLKSDVNLPQQDLEAKNISLKQHITEQLQNSTLVQKYCDTTKLQNFMQNSSELYFWLKPMLLINVEKQLQETGAKLIED